MATPTDVLGSRLVREYKDFTTGTWTCTKGSGNATQATTANRPTVSSLPSGQSAPEFFEAASPNHDYLSLPALSALPAFSTAHNRLWACVFRFDGFGPHGASIIWRGDDSYNVTFDGRLEAGGAKSNDVVTLGAWYRVIVRKNGAGNVIMTVNGVDQTTTGTFSLGSGWRTDTDQVIGARANGDYPFDGVIGSMLFAYSTTTAFSSTDVTDLDAALALYLAAGSTGYTLPVTAVSIPFSGKNVGLLAGRKLPVTSLAIPFSGKTVGTLRGYRVPVTPAANAFSGKSVNLLVGRRLPVSVAAVPCAGQDVGLKRGLRLPVTTAAVAFSGKNVTLTYTPLGAYVLPVTALAIPVATQNVSLKRGLRLPVTAASIPFSGKNVTLTYTPAGAYVLPVTTLAIPVATNDVALKRGLRLPVSVQAIPFSGKNVDGRKGYALSVTPVAIPVTARDVTFRRTYRLAITALSVPFTGRVVTLRYTPSGQYDGAADIELEQSVATFIELAQSPATLIELAQRASTQITFESRMKLYVGDDNNLDFTFKDPDTGALLDPTAVVFSVFGPNDLVPTIYTYGVDDNTSRESQGKYRCVIDCDRAGHWVVVCRSPGPAAKGVETGEFDVFSVRQ